MAQEGPGAVQADLIEPLEIRHLSASDGVAEGIDRAELAGANNVFPSADLPGEIQVSRRTQVGSREQEEEQHADDVGRTFPDPRFGHGE